MNTEPVTGDRLTHAIASLPVMDVEQARADGIRERSRAALACRRDGRPGRTGRTAWRRLVEPALVAGVSAAFLVEVVGRALSLRGF